MGGLIALRAGSVFAGEVTEAQRTDVRAGLRAYDDGDTEEALRLWRPVFDTLARPQRFRLAFNLARASDKVGRDEDAALFYEEFIDGLKAAKVPDVTDRAFLDEEGTRANARLLALRSTLARVAFADGLYVAKVSARTFHPRDIVYLHPETYRFVFTKDEKSLDERSVTLHAGEARVLGPEFEVRLRGTLDPIQSPPPAIEVRSGPPFPPAVLYLGAGLTVASVALPIFTFVDGTSYHESHHLSSSIAEEGRNASIRAEYASLETRHYLAMSVPITLGLATGALALWYALSPRRAVKLEGAMLRF